MTVTTTRRVERKDQVVIRFAGDSGDGMQLTGDRFAIQTATIGHNLSTQPDYPAEIRAPAGTVAGVSSYQVKFADHEVLTAGDPADVLIAMNPAALRATLADPQLLRPQAVVIVDADEFSKRGLQRAGYTNDPLSDGSLDAFDVHAVPITSLTKASMDGLDVSRKQAERARNMFALGLVSWMFS